MKRKGPTGLTSMTGFGRAQVSFPLRFYPEKSREAGLPSEKGMGLGRAAVEIRTVNHRFLEIEARLPEGLQGFEEDVRAAVTKAIRRGQVRVNVTVRLPEVAVPVVVDQRLAQAYLRDLKRLKRQMGLAGEPTLETLLSLPQVLRPADRAELGTKQWPRLDRALRQALAEAVRMRRREGARLGRALRRVLQETETLAGRIRARAPQVERKMERRLIEKVRAASRRTSGFAPDRQAVLAQVADFVHSADVREELDRIESHLAALKATAAGRSPQTKDPAASPGRTLDFLAQELHREVNTLGTKLRDTAVVQWVVRMKGQIEKLREQAANLE